MTSPADSGLQAERTSLAWRRTALSVAIGSLVGMRVLPPHLGAFGYIASLTGLLWSLDLAVSAARRYGQADELLRSTGRQRAAGVTVARTAVLTGLAGVVALVGVLVIGTLGA